MNEGLISGLTVAGFMVVWDLIRSWWFARYTASLVHKKPKK